MIAKGFAPVKTQNLESDLQDLIDMCYKKDLQERASTEQIISAIENALIKRIIQQSGNNPQLLQIQSQLQITQFNLTQEQTNYQNQLTEKDKQISQLTSQLQSNLYQLQQGIQMKQKLQDENLLLQQQIQELKEITYSQQQQPSQNIISHINLSQNNPNTQMVNRQIDQSSLINNQDNSIKTTMQMQQSQYQSPYANQIFPRLNLNSLIQEQQSNSNLQQQIQQLASKFNAVRNIPQDANSYYRAIGYAYLEHLIRQTTPKQEILQFIDKLQQAKGYFTIRTSYTNAQELRQQFLELLKNLEQKREENNTSCLLEKLLQNQDKYDQSLVWEMRTLTANYLETHKQNYSNPSLNFQEQISNILDMSKLAESFAIGPLQIVLGVKIETIALDQNENKLLQFDYQIRSQFPFLFLFKSGYYGLIYPIEISKADGYLDEKFIGKDKFKTIKFNIDEWPFRVGKNEELKLRNSSKGQQNIQSQQNQIMQQSSFMCMFGECNKPLQYNEVVWISNCKHMFCKECFVSYLYSQTNGKMVCHEYEYGFETKCPYCESLINHTDIKQALDVELFNMYYDEMMQRFSLYILQNNIPERGRQRGQSMKKLKYEQEINKCQKTNCINKEQKPQLICLGCGHKYCRQCLYKYLNEKTQSLFVQNKHEQNVKCDIENCKYVIQNLEIKETIGEQEFQKCLEKAKEREEKYKEAQKYFKSQ